MKLSLVTVVIAATAAACASSPPPTARYASTSAAVRAAQEVGADRVPEAQLHLKMAEDQLGQARRLMQDGEQDKAAWTLARAQSDADLALALAREAEARTSAEATAVQARHIAEGRNP